MNLCVHPKLTMLGREECLQIHHASCKILRTTGVQVHSQAGLALLGQAGAVVTNKLAKLPPSLVEWALASTPSSFNLYKRGTSDVAVRLNGQDMYFGPGSDTLHYLDPRSGQRREYQLTDIADCIRLCDALPEIDFVMSVGIPRDVPGDAHYRYQFATMLRHTAKPIVFVCNDLADIEAWVRERKKTPASGYNKLTQARGPRKGGNPREGNPRTFAGWVG